MTDAKRTCPCNTLRTSLARSDTGVVIDIESHLSRICKTSLVFAALAIHIQACGHAFPFYTQTKPLIQLYFKCKTVLNPKLKIINIL